ncbi:MAG TPA: hypothetical protein VGK59_10960 [Ohtaekwangia sp.]
MIGIKLDGVDEYLDTPDDISINIRLENPLLGDAEKISPGSYSLPFDLPGGDISPKNSALLKHPDVIENNESYQIQKASLSYNGVPFKSGNLKSKGINGGKISSYFTFGLNSISEDFKKARIRDILDEDVVISSASFVKGVLIFNLWSSPGTDHTIIVNGQSYTIDALLGFSVLINTYYDANMVSGSGVYLPRASIVSGKLRIVMATTNPLLVPPFTEMVESTDPHIGLHIDIPAEDRANWTVEVFDMADYYQPFKDFAGTEGVKFPVRFNANLYEGEAVKAGEIINGVNSSGLIVNDANWGFDNTLPLQVKNYNSLQPFILVKYLLDRVASVFAFQYEGDFYDSLTTQPRFIDNAITLDLPMDFLGDQKYVFWRRSFNKNEFVPDMGVVDFFKALANRYNIGIYYNETTRKVRLKLRENVSKANAYDDITALSSPVLPIEDQRVTGFKMVVRKEEKDTFSVDETYTVGTPEKELPIACGRLHQMQTTLIEGSPVTGPYVSVKNKESIGLRIFHSLGMVDAGPFSYEAAGIHGTTINESVANIYTSFWQYWLHFEKNSLLVKVNTAFPLRMLLQFDWEQKRRFNRVNYLVKAIDLKLSNKVFSVSGVELLTQH